MTRAALAAGSLVVTQVTSTLADNIIRAAAMAMMLTHGGTAGAMTTLAFVLPYILLSPLAGQIGDRVAKTRLILRLKLLEIGLVALMIAAIVSGWPWLMLVVTLLSGAQASFLSPARLALVPEIAPDNILRLSSLMDGTMFLAILAGTSLGLCLPVGGQGGIAHGTTIVVGSALVALAIGLPAAFALRHAHPDTAPHEVGVFDRSWFRMTGTLARRVRECGKGRDLLALSAFWSLAAVLTSEAEPLARALDLPASAIRILVPSMSVGMGVGSILTALVPHRTVMVPAVILTAFCLGFPFLAPGLHAMLAVCALSFLACAAGGVLSSNLYANAMRDTGTHTSSVMAANNVLNSVMMALASLVLIAAGHMAPGLAIALFALVALPVFAVSSRIRPARLAA